MKFFLSYSLAEGVDIQLSRLLFHRVSTGIRQMKGRGTRLAAMPFEDGLKPGQKIIPPLLIGHFTETRLWHKPVKISSPSIVQIIDDLRSLFTDYIRTEDNRILAYIKSFIRSLKKSKINKLKRLFSPTQFTKNKLHSLGFIDRRKKIRSLILFTTSLFTNVSGCEEDSYFAFSKDEILFSNYQTVVYVQQRRTD